MPNNLRTTLRSGEFRAISDAVRAHREAHLLAEKRVYGERAALLRGTADQLDALYKQLVNMPGSYAVWTRIADAAGHARSLAQQWEERKK